ncbi:MAG: hypothetical protein IJV06_08785 [Bacteroidaceae bacterium]|nr:hypothetical protein [Bacteroidaceae bacterium]
MKHISPIFFLALLASACTDKLLDEFYGNNGDFDDDGMVFSLNVQEQADLAYEQGGTRAATLPGDTAATEVEDPTFGPRLFDGGVEDMKVYALQLPFVGIHPKTVASGIAPETRASVDAIIPAGNNQITFHDSLTIWGYAYNDDGTYSRELFGQRLLKKIRGWRSSVHWPYDNGQATKMRFYAVSPSLEELEDLQVKAAPTYNSPPVFSYTIPDDPDEQRDLLYGESDEIDVQAGPPTGTGRYENTGTTEKEQHLGDDDKTVTLNFKHLLTTIRFAQGRIPVGAKITKIGLYHIKNEGTYYPQAVDNVVLPMPGLGDTGLGNWVVPSGEGGTGSYEIDVDAWTAENYTPGGQSPTTSTLNFENVYKNTDGENEYITDKVLFVMPHIVTQAAQLQVTIDMGDGKGERKLTSSLIGCYWKKGYTITYYITIGNIKGDYYLLVEPSTYQTTGEIEAPKAGETGDETKYSTGSMSAEHSNAQTTGSFIIHSFRNYKNYSAGEPSGVNVHERAGWRVNGFSPTNDSEDSKYGYTANNRPAWLMSITGWKNVSNAVGESEGTKMPTNSSGDNQLIDYIIAPQSPVYTANHKTVLNGHAEVEASIDFDLSRTFPDKTATGTPMASESGTGPINTANCYIVNAAGTYKFPLVYGNSFKNGAESPNTTDAFVDHIGEKITHAYILDQIKEYSSRDVVTILSSTEKRITSIKYDDGTHSGLSAELLWQDVEGLVSDLALDYPSSSGGFMKFRVNKANIQPGNCLVALKANKKFTKIVVKEDGKDDVIEQDWTASPTSEILWTWHIWVTDEVYPNAEMTIDVNPGVTDDAGVKDNLQKKAEELYLSYNSDKSTKIVTLNDDATKQILPVNLGWVPDNMEWGIYQPREVWVEIEQLNEINVTTGNKIHLKIRQEAIPELVTGTSMVYQWGRPTALPMKLRVDGTTARTLYDGTTDISASFAAADIASPAEAISNPTKMAQGWNPTADYWGGSAKTLYDPCPPGFQMPAGSVFSVFSMTGTDTADGTKLNMRPSEGASNKGGYFYTKAHTALTDDNRYDPKVYMPATGYWSGEGYTQTNPAAGYYWTNERTKSLQLWPVGDSNGYIYFGKTDLTGEKALPVRPVKSN